MKWKKGKEKKEYNIEQTSLRHSTLTKKRQERKRITRHVPSPTLTEQKKLKRRQKRENKILSKIREMINAKKKAKRVYQRTSFHFNVKKRKKNKETGKDGT